MNLYDHLSVQFTKSESTSHMPSTMYNKVVFPSSNLCKAANCLLLHVLLSHLFVEYSISSIIPFLTYNFNA